MRLPPVRLEGEAYGDPKFAHLARLLGYPNGDGHFALVKVSIIWSWQSRHYTPEAPCFVVSERVIEMALGEGGAAKMVRAGLAEEHPDGYFIVGSNHKRTGWLWRDTDKGQKGGKASVAAKKSRKARNKAQPVVEPGLSTGQAGVDPLSSSFYGFPSGES
jgi:hypothetical protein